LQWSITHLRDAESLQTAAVGSRRAANRCGAQYDRKGELALRVSSEQMAEAPSTRNAGLSEASAIETFVNSPDFFQRLFEQLYEGVYFVDSQRRITYWNRAAHRISGYTPEEVIGHYCQTTS
jgi:PAS domain-containing protein